MRSAPDAARPGLAGRADLHFAVRDGRTRLVRSDTRPPLQVQRALYLDERVPEMVFTYLANPTAGIFAGDCLCVDVQVAPGARVHLTTPAAARAFAMPEGSAAQETRLMVAGGGYLEYLPDPLIPYGGARFRQATTVRAAPGATAIVADILMPGRAAHGESLAFAELSSRLTVEAEDGLPHYHEALTLAPAGRGVPGPGVFGDIPTPVIGTLLVITDAVPPSRLLAAVRDALLPQAGATAAATTLPFGLGVGVKALGAETPPVRAQVRAAWGAARRLLLDAEPPPHRKG